MSDPWDHWPTAVLQVRFVSSLQSHLLGAEHVAKWTEEFRAAAQKLRDAATAKNEGVLLARQRDLAASVEAEARARALAELMHSHSAAETTRHTSGTHPNALKLKQSEFTSIQNIASTQQSTRNIPG